MVKVILSEIIEFYQGTPADKKTGTVHVTVWIWDKAISYNFLRLLALQGPLWGGS